MNILFWADSLRKQILTDINYDIPVQDAALNYVLFRTEKAVGKPSFLSLSFHYVKIITVLKLKRVGIGKKDEDDIWRKL